MTDPVKPRRKVASQISLAPSPTPGSSSSSVPARVRAHVFPTTVSPSPSERPSIRSAPSATSLRSTPISRARSPAPSSTPIARVTTRTPRTPVTTTLPPRSAVGLTPRDGTSIAKVRATKSVIDSPITSSRTPRTPDIRRSNTNTEEDHRKRTLSLRSNTGGNSAPIARVRSNGQALTPSTPIHSTSLIPSTPVHHTQNVNAPSPSIQNPPPTNFHSSPIPDIVSTPATTTIDDNESGSASGSGSGPFNINGLGMDDGGIKILDSTWRNSSPERISDSESHIDISSNRSSPSRRSPKLLPSSNNNTISSAQHALSYIFHPSASAPTSPIPSSTPTKISHIPKLSTHKRGNSITNNNHNHNKIKLPFHPHSQFPPSLPPPPISPELKTVALPSLTPARSSEDWSRTNSSQGYGAGLRKYSATGSDNSGQVMEMKKDDSRDRLSGATVVEDLDSSTGGIKAGDHDVDVLLGADAEEAKVNRKIADLKISNASLLAINKTLEATKSKQRTEILKLRRMLRESIGGNSLPLSSFSSFNPLSSPLGLLSPSTDKFGEEGLNLNDPEGAYFDEEMSDPQLEARWEKIADLVNNMKRRGENAVEMGKEEIKFGPGRVLNWAEVEQNRKNQIRESGRGEGEGKGEGEENFDPDLSMDSINPNDLEEEYAGELSREEVDNVI